MSITKEISKGVAGCLILLLPLCYLWNGPELETATQVPSISQPSAAQLPWLDTQRFQYHIQTRLPSYQGHFQEAAQKYGVPWTLLASQAYQESRWNRHAKSPTGVRGIMMLTRNTASSLGITNRLDPVQSIYGGAKYFSHLEDQIPEHIQEPDRTFIALAAYNVGMGHIKDAQELAKRLNKNPHSWKDLKTVLPLLSKKQFYKTLRYGYARGHEPVHYVKRIRAYWEYLERSLGEV